ncbi:MAG TPA: nitroreductase family protein [Longimicrobiaceae bacterium]|nr:nitroreductase family protein [Longimicrobiaceae bacterium]
MSAETAEAEAVPGAYPARPAETAVPLHPAIAARWSPSRFAAEDEVGRDELLALLDAARWAPSSGNEQPARWVVVPRGHPRRAAVEAALKPGNAWAKRAALLLVSLAKTTRAKGSDRNAWAEHDLGISTGFLLVQATALGLAAHPMGGWDPEALRAAVDAPEDHRPMAVVAVGRYDAALEDERLLEREARPRTRKPLAEIAFLGAVGGEPVG